MISVFGHLFNLIYLNLDVTDECSTATHQCDKNAVCINTEMGYACQCNMGFIDVNPSNPGMTCSSTMACCDELTYGLNGIEQYTVTCKKVRVQTNGFFDYQCFPKFGLDLIYRFPVYIQYSLFHEKYFVTEEVSLAAENESDIRGIKNEYGLAATSKKKCCSEDLAFPYFTVECLKMDHGPIDECETGLHNCHFFEQCTDKI